MAGTSSGAKTWAYLQVTATVDDNSGVAFKSSKRWWMVDGGWWIVDGGDGGDEGGVCGSCNRLQKSKLVRARGCVQCHGQYVSAVSSGWKSPIIALVKALSTELRTIILYSTYSSS